MLLIHETVESARESALLLRQLGSPARRIVAECVEHQEIRRSRLSVAAEALSEAGFVRVVDDSDISGAYTLLPTLFGEEALDALETMEQKHG